LRELRAGRRAQVLQSRQQSGQENCMKERIDRHKDGSIKAKGHMKDGELEGYWEWFRKDGTKMRSGYFENGRQVGGEWTTYDAKEQSSKSRR
jgi:antitoxin component YwqK of YwqJK toxin-antitoxin module